MGQMNEWSVIVYDKPDKDRMTVFEEHVKGLPEFVKNRSMITGGQISDDSDPRKPIGSNFIIRAETKEDVINILKNDAFYKNGIWDMENIIIHHLFCVYREGLEYQL